MNIRHACDNTWLQRLQYLFYKKPMASKFTLLKRSAMPENMKRSTVAQEILRRWKTTSEWRPREEFERVTREYMDDLAGMGYNPQWREAVLKSTTVAYSRLLAKCQTGETRRNRKGVDTYVKRRFNKLCGNQEWFKSGENYEQRLEEIRHSDWEEISTNRRHRRHDDRYIEAVMFIPFTPESRLKARLTSLESNLGFKTRYRYGEQAGRTLSQHLVRKDPIGAPCGREKCFPCQTKGGTCTRKGAIYRMRCLVCHEDGKKAYYIGETARAPFDRGQEHLDALRRQDRESPLVEHSQDCHPGVPARFQMEIVRTPRGNLERQVAEGIEIMKISEDPSVKVLNRRGEWGQNLPPRLTLEDDSTGLPQAKSGPKRKRRPRAAEDVAPDVNQGGGGGPGQDPDQGGPGAAAPTPQNTHIVPVFPEAGRSETDKPRRARNQPKPDIAQS